jgi:hypothetical protein
MQGKNYTSDSLILHTKQTGRHDNDFTAHGYRHRVRRAGLHRVRPGLARVARRLLRARVDALTR